MEMEDFKDSIKYFIDSRLKSPYFASVLFSWLIANRVIVYSLFNFEEQTTLEKRLEWISLKLNQHTFFGISSFHGVYATIGESLICGLLLMIIYNKVNVYTKGLYLYIDRGSKNYLQKREPINWISIKIYEKDLKELSIVQDELTKKREDNTRYQNENVDNRAQIGKLTIDLEKVKEELIKSEREQEAKENQLIEIQNQQSQFKVVYATYGKFEKIIEVTHLVQNLIQEKGAFDVTNLNLRFDPLPNKIKELKIQYTANGKTKEMHVLEEESVILTNDELIVNETVKSKNNKKSLELIEKIADEFKTGAVFIIRDSMSNVSKDAIQIDLKGDMIIGGEVRYNLTFEGNMEKLIITKILPNSYITHSTETLQKQNTNLWIGKDNKENEIEYLINQLSL